jgi:hypothetical protein
MNEPKRLPRGMWSQHDCVTAAEIWQMSHPRSPFLDHPGRRGHRPLAGAARPAGAVPDLWAATPTRPAGAPAARCGWRRNSIARAARCRTRSIGCAPPDGWKRSGATSKSRRPASARRAPMRIAYCSTATICLRKRHARSRRATMARAMQKTHLKRGGANLLAPLRCQQNSTRVPTHAMARLPIHTMAPRTSP